MNAAGTADMGTVLVRLTVQDVKQVWEKEGDRVLCRGGVVREDCPAEIMFLFSQCLEYEEGQYVLTG